MSVTETMTRIYALLDKHAPKLMTPVNVGAMTRGKYDIRRGRALTESEKVKARRLRKSGHGYDEIAWSLGVSRTTVYRAVNPGNHAH
jgi:hypothetical protein